MRSIWLIIYNLYFHPLRSYPGPLLFRASRLPWTIRFWQGRLVYDIMDMHSKYGPVVRIAPDELSFTSPDAWRDVHARRGHTAELIKYAPFYRPHILIPETFINAVPERHAPIRRNLAPNFSERAIRDHEPILNEYISLLVRQLRKVSTKGPADLVDWYGFTSFDIICDLALGSSFRCVEQSDYHPWCNNLRNFEHDLMKITMLQFLGVGWLIPVVGLLGMRSHKMHHKYLREFLLRRSTLKGERPDLVEGLMKMQKAGVGYFLLALYRAPSGAPQNVVLNNRGCYSLI